MLNFKTYQKLYDGNYDQFYEDIGETTMKWDEFVKRKDLWIDKSKSNEWKDESGNELKLANPDDFASTLSGINTESDFNSIFKDGSKYIEVIELDGATKIKFNHLSKTHTMGGKSMSAADKTARQEGFGAIAMMLANSIPQKQEEGKNIFIDDTFPDYLEKSTNWGSYNDSDEFVRNKTGYEEFVKFFITPTGRTERDVEKIIGKSILDIMELVVHDPDWLKVSMKTADTALNDVAFKASIQSEKTYEVHRGSEFMNLIYKVYKESAKATGVDSAITKNDKWNPGDVWMVDADQMESIQKILQVMLDGLKDGYTLTKLYVAIKKLNNFPEGKSRWESILHMYNWMIQEWFDKDMLKGVSLKKLGEKAQVTEYNADAKGDLDSISVEFTGFRVSDEKNPLTTKDIYLQFRVEEGRDIHDYEMQLRSFDNKVQAIQGEIKGKHANHGKVGVGVILYLFGLGSELQGKHANYGKISRTSTFKKWRSLLAKIYKKNYRTLVESFRVVSNKRPTKDVAFMKSKEDSSGYKKILLKQCLMLQQYIFESKMKFRDLWKNESKYKMANIASKIQALEICAYLKDLDDDKGTVTIEKLGTGRMVDLLMKSVYFYASSRGNVESGAFSSKFLKIG